MDATPTYDLTLHRIPLDDIYENPNNRKVGGLGDIEKLAAAIKKIGQLVPAIVAKNVNGTYQLVDGHRRLAAIKLLQEQDPTTPATLTAIVVDDVNEGIELMAGLSANEQREDLREADRARAFQQVLMWCPPDDVAEATGLDLKTAKAIKKTAAKVEPQYVADITSLIAIAEYEHEPWAQDIIASSQTNTNVLAAKLRDEAGKQKLLAEFHSLFPNYPVIVTDHYDRSVDGYLYGMRGRTFSPSEPCGCDGFTALFRGNPNYLNAAHPAWVCTKRENHEEEIAAWLDEDRASQAQAREALAAEAQRRALEKEEVLRSSHGRLKWLWQLNTAQTQKEMNLWHDLSMRFFLLFGDNGCGAMVEMALKAAEATFGHIENSAPTWRRALFALTGAAYVEFLFSECGTDLEGWEHDDLLMLSDYADALDCYKVPEELALPIDMAELAEAIQPTGAA